MTQIRYKGTEGMAQLVTCKWAKCFGWWSNVHSQILSRDVAGACGRRFGHTAFCSLPQGLAVCGDGSAVGTGWSHRPTFPL